MTTPEHLHLALNHFPILGVPLAGAVAACGVATKNHGTLRTGLALLVLCAAFTPAVMSTGQNASDSYDGADFIDSEGYALMIEHGERAAKAAIAAYVAGALALVGLALAFLSEKPARIAGVFAVTGAFVASGLSVWTADIGGKIRRPDFREKITQPVSTTPPESE